MYRTIVEACTIQCTALLSCDKTRKKKNKTQRRIFSLLFLFTLSYVFLSLFVIIYANRFILPLYYLPANVRYVSLVSEYGLVINVDVYLIEHSFDENKNENKRKKDLTISRTMLPG